MPSKELFQSGHYIPPVFLIQIEWDFKDDVESWVIEEHGSKNFRVPLINHIVVDTCRNIFYCHKKGDWLAISIGIPGTRNWRHVPSRSIPNSSFSGMDFDSSTRCCTLFLNYSYIDQRKHQGQSDNQIIVMSIYDSKSNVWT
jgi:hypothetical protein